MIGDFTKTDDFERLFALKFVDCVDDVAVAWISSSNQHQLFDFLFDDLLVFFVIFFAIIYPLDTLYTCRMEEVLYEFFGCSTIVGNSEKDHGMYKCKM